MKKKFPQINCNVSGTLVNRLLAILIFSASILKHLAMADGLEKLNQNNEENASENSPSETSFLEWTKWRKLYKSCNPKQNPFTSPIDIFLSSVQKTEDMQTLLVHANRPEENIYLFSTFYDTEKVQMESFNIKPRGDEVLNYATYIHGLGSSKYRVFKNALIMFRPGKNEEPLQDRQRFHSIDEKEYPMEIMLNFEAHSTSLEKTQIHVLVELAAEENPIWIPILNVFGDLIHKIVHETCFGSMRSKIAVDNLQAANNLYKEALRIEKNETQGLTYKLAVKELKELTELLKDAGDEAMEGRSKKQQDALTQQHKCQEQLISVDKEIKMLENKLYAYASPNDDQQVIVSGIISRKAALLNISRNLSTCIEEEGEKLSNLQNEMFRQNELKRKSRVGNKSADLFRSVEDVSRLLDEMEEKLEILEFVKNVYENAHYSMDNLNDVPVRSVLIQDPFQISWLLPSTGGFYFYNGSSPVPPCKRKSHVIVLKRPITISEEQLNQFQNFPSFSQPSSEQITKICELKAKGINDNSTSAAIIKLLMTMEKIRLQVPPLKPLGNRSVWYNPKSIQFIDDDDGVHMQSSRKRLLLEEQEENSTDKVKVNWVVTFYLIFSMTAYC